MRSTMRTFLLLALFITALSSRTGAQQTCGSFDYQQKELKDNPLLKGIMDNAETLIQQRLHTIAETETDGKGEHLPLITIPVVVHILYNSATENISDQEVYNQIALLNQHFRRLHADTTKTPARFLDLAADCDIQFKLAISDPKRWATTGIIRRYTPVTKWEANDNMKFSANGGDDAWDANSYLNIWVCNLNRIQGYAAAPGGEAAKDGVVLNYNIFRYNRTIIHETGHWLGLKHIWGDASCGDDGVADTPPQSTFTPGCPTGIRISCSNGPNGDMYMNYMDLTTDVCMNLFTEGQKMRMRAVLEGVRAGILSSNGLLPPLVNEIPPAEEAPKWYYANVYPNPAQSEVTMDISYDVRWVGKMITVSTVQGVPVMLVPITSKITTFNVANLKPGIYFLTAKKEDGTTIKHKLIKM
jgi:hypothetical protein